MPELDQSNLPAEGVSCYPIVHYGKEDFLPESMMIPPIVVPCPPIHFVALCTKYVLC